MSAEAPVTAVCLLHKSHAPAPLTIEEHHVVPVAWQQVWAPQVQPYPGTDPNGRGHLWDARTIPVAPTCHRNVHVWIVRLMRALAGGESADQAFTAAHGRAGGAQAAWAYQALLRFSQYGGSLQHLVAAGEWGAS